MSAAVVDAAPDHGSRPLRELDGLRGLAALGVFLYHAATPAVPVSRHLWRLFGVLNAGVAVFFVLSGFLIYRPFAAANIERRAAPGLVSYSIRRVLRIYPAYLVCLVITWRLKLININGPVAFLKHAALVDIYFPPNARGGVGLPVSWSLQVEVAFYVFAPLWGLALRQLGNGIARVSRRRLDQFVVEAVCVIALGAAGVWAMPRNVAPTAHNVDAVLLPWMGELGCGMLLAIIVVAAPHHRGAASIRSTLARIPTFVWWLGAAVALYELGHRTVYGLACTYCVTTQQAVLSLRLQLPLAALLVTPLVLGPPGRGAIRRLLSSTPMGWLGLVSFSLYLWHTALIHQFPIGWKRKRGVWISLSTVAAELALSLAVATLSYLVVERPCMRLARRLTAGRRRRSPPARDRSVTSRARIGAHWRGPGNTPHHP
jgi:peptidoglycan/LPS O-acetylase OafA/YrhL